MSHWSFLERIDPEQSAKRLTAASEAPPLENSSETERLMADSTDISKPAPEGEPSAQPMLRWRVLPIVLLGLLVMVWPVVYQEVRDGAILRHGTAAKARVIALKPTGSSHNDDQEVRLTLEVLPVGRDPYPAKVETDLHPAHFPRYQPGALNDVRFDRTKPSRVSLVAP